MQLVCQGSRADWLPELPPEEKDIALWLHREWFLPSLHLRH
jgi:hypothetical protein